MLRNSFSFIISRNFPLHSISKSVNNFFLHAHFSQCRYSILCKIAAQRSNVSSYWGGNLYPGITRFRGILSLIQVYIFEIYVKFCVFDTHHEGVERNKILDPSHVPVRFFAAAWGRAHAIEKFFFAGFACFTSKWNYCRVTGPPKNFLKLKIHSPYCPFKYKT
jgi:hypothetical protein